MRKWTYELIAVVVLLCVAGGIWWFISTKEQRQADAQYEQLVKFVKRQAVEIAAIKQSAELQRLRAAMVQTQRQAQAQLQQQAIPQLPDPTDIEN